MMRFKRGHRVGQLQWLKRNEPFIEALRLVAVLKSIWFRPAVFLGVAPIGRLKTGQSQKKAEVENRQLGESGGGNSFMNLFTKSLAFNKPGFNFNQLATVEICLNSIMCIVFFWPRVVSNKASYFTSKMFQQER